MAAANSSPDAFERTPTPWKNIGLAFCLILFCLMSYSYLRGNLEGSGAWLWPLLFVPLTLYFLGIIYGDVPSRYYKLSALTPFTIPFSMQYDRAVVAIILLFSGLAINAGLLLLALIFEASLWLVLFYAVYIGIMLFELPYSVKIFRFLQHVQIVRQGVADAPSIFDEAHAYAGDEIPTLAKLDEPKRLRQIYQKLQQEAQSLVREYSPLNADQQYALHLALRGGEAIYEARKAMRSGEAAPLAANLAIITALVKNAHMEPPTDLERMRETLADWEESPPSASHLHPA